jgi:hypothetical protein
MAASSRVRQGDTGLQRLAVPPRWLRFITLAAVVLASAACFVALKAGLEHAPPARLVAFRLLIGGASLLAVLAATGGRLVPRRDLWPWILALGIAVTAFAYGAMAASLVFTGAGIASVLGNSQPLLAVALGVWLLGERFADHASGDGRHRAHPAGDRPDRRQGVARRKAVQSIVTPRVDLSPNVVPVHTGP